MEWHEAKAPIGLKSSLLVHTFVQHDANIIQVTVAVQDDEIFQTPGEKIIQQLVPLVTRVVVPYKE